MLARELGGVQLEPDPAALSATCADADRAAPAVAELARSGVSIADFAVGQPSLDEVFLALTGTPPAAETTEQGRRDRPQPRRHAPNSEEARHERQSRDRSRDRAASRPSARRSPAVPDRSARAPSPPA